MASKTIPVKNCAVCNKKIITREFLQCTSCDNFFDVTCTSNVSLKLFTIMTIKTKDVWKCHFCTGSKDQGAYVPTESTFTPNNNVTRRNKYTINVSTENSFQSLSDDEVLDDTANTSTHQVNRSCPGRSNDSFDLTELKAKIECLQNKLGSAEAEIENLLFENFSLQKKIADQDKKIEHLSRICRSPSHKIIKKKTNNATLNMTNSSPKPSTTSTTTLNTSQDVGFHTEPKLTPIARNRGTSRNIEQRPTKVIKDVRKHRVLLLADETGRGLCNILQNRLGCEYEVTSSLKPNASLEQILSGSLAPCRYFTKSDFIIIMAGAHDKYLVKLQSALFYCLNVFTNTNILFGQTSGGASWKDHTLENFLSSLDPFFNNWHYSQLFYHNKRKLDKGNTCRSLALDIIKVSHINSILNNETKTVHMTKDSDRFFRVD